MRLKVEIDIEELVRWTYQDQRADLVVGSGAGLYEGEAYVDGVGGFFGSGGDSCTKVRRAGLLGCRVDGGGFNPGDLHPDAEAVHEAVMGLVVEDESAGLLVLQLGLAGCRPDWRKDARPRWEPCQMRQRKGIWEPVYDYHPKYRAGRKPFVCWIRLIDDPISTAWARRVYDNWRGGLVGLCEVFTANRDAVVDHIVSGPVAPHQPWKAQETAI